MRGFKVDHTATAIARASGKITHPRSFISQPKAIPGEWNGRPHSHLVLHGKDKGPIREQIFAENRKKNGGIARCGNCNRPGSWSTLEWHHIRSKPAERCDCPSNGQLLCGPCHRGPNGTHPGRM